MTIAVSAYDHVMGTSVEIRVGSTSDSAVAESTRSGLAELRRLEKVFSIFDTDSELSRWRRGALVDASQELSLGLTLAIEWFERTGGRFNPHVGELMDLWRGAERLGVAPTETALSVASEQIRPLRLAVSGESVVRTGDCSKLDLNALAKGLAVDLAMNAGFVFDIESLCLNVGGDLLHRGSGSALVGIENPHRPYDNEPPLRQFRLSNAAVATSGNARRWFSVAGNRHGQVLDPRTGWPVTEVASVTVVAKDAASADVLATSAGVQGFEEAIASLDALHDVEGFVVRADGVAAGTDGWAQFVDAV